MGAYGPILSGRRLPSYVFLMAEAGRHQFRRFPVVLPDHLADMLERLPSAGATVMIYPDLPGLECRRSRCISGVVCRNSLYVVPDIDVSRGMESWELH